jgi:probable rRNA maturation factor
VTPSEVALSDVGRPPPAQVFGADEQSAVAIDVLRWIRLTRLVLQEERVPRDAEVSVVFVDEDTIADLNRRFLGGTGPTDVLAFPIDEEALPGGRHPDEGGRGPGASDEADEPPIVLGDVLVCPAVAARQAPTHGQSLDDELALLVVHGVLHLLDYDHAEDDEAARMQHRERQLLARFAELESASDVTTPAAQEDERSDGHQ